MTTAEGLSPAARHLMSRNFSAPRSAPKPAALDVEELFRAEVCAEARLGDDVIGKLQRRLRGDDRIAAVGNIGERPAVDERGRAFERLHEVGFQGVFQKRRHGARRLEIARRHGSALIGVAHDDARKPRFQVAQRGSKAQDRHHFACDGDIEPVLAGDAVLAAAEAVFDVAKLAVVHVHAAAKNDLFGIDMERVALEDMVIQHGAQKVVRRADSVEIAREVQVDVLHRDDLGISAARRAGWRGNRP